MLVEFCLGFGVDAVEVVEQVGDVAFGFALCLGAARQVVNDGFGMNFLLNVERRRGDNEVRPVLLIIAAPCELGIGYVDIAGLRRLLDLLGC